MIQMPKINWLLTLYFLLASANALATAIIASFMNTEWGSLTSTRKFLLVWVVLQNWTGVMVVFFRTAVVRLERGLPPVPKGDTEVIEKAKTTQT